MSTDSSSVAGDTWVDVQAHDDVSESPVEMSEAGSSSQHDQLNSVPDHAATAATADDADAAPAQVHDSDEESPPSHPDIAGECPVQPVADGPSAQVEAPAHVEIKGNEKPASAQIDPAWCGKTECHINDIRYSEKPAPTLPERRAKTQLTLLFAGQPETGRSTTGRNLLAALANDAAFELRDSSGLQWEDFKRDAAPFTTRVVCQDSDQPLEVAYTVIETPGLTLRSGGIGAMTDLLSARHAAFAKQEHESSRARDCVTDDRIDAILYFLPTNARVAELDVRAMTRLAALAPVVPIMCKADCLEEKEVQRRKDEMARLITDGLPIFSFPPSLVGPFDSAQSLGALSLSSSAEVAPPMPFRPPFNIVTGVDADGAVHPFWFVRKYRWGACEAYCTSNSDLRLLRQLVLEDGFWALKDAADRIFRASRAAAAPEATLPAVEPPSPTSAAASGDVAARGALDRTAQPYTLAQAFCRTGTRGGMGRPMRCVPPSMCAADSRLFGLATSVATEAPAAPPADPTPAPPPPPEPVTVPSSAAAAPSAGDAGHGANAAGKDADTFDSSGYVPVVVRQVRKSNERKTYRLTLQVEGSEKVLCLRVGEQEGSSLGHVLMDSKVARPTAYDMMASMVEALGCVVRRVVITKCEQTLFYARIHAENKATGGVVDVDARPSDAINLAVRQSAPVFVKQEVIDKFAKAE